MLRALLLSVLYAISIFGHSIEFSGDSNSLKDYRVLTLALIKQGYEFDIDRFVIDDVTKIDITINNPKKYNLKDLTAQLHQFGVVVDDRYVEKNIEFIKLDFTNAHLALEILELDTTTQLNKSSQSQWFRLPQDAKEMRIEPPYESKYFALVAIYDKNLNSLYSLMKNEPLESLAFELPQDSKYVKFSNLYGMKMVKDSVVVEILK